MIYLNSLTYKGSRKVEIMSICTCVAAYRKQILWWAVAHNTNYGDGARRSACHPRPPRPALLTNSHLMYVISPLARTHRSNAQLDQRPSGIAKKITFPRLPRGLRCNIIDTYFTSLVYSHMETTCPRSVAHLCLSYSHTSF